MDGKLPRRAEALALLHEYTKSENLRAHALAVEAAMRAYARRFGEDEELWGLVGLIHDFDYERFPTMEQHPAQGVAILRQRGYPEAVIEGVLAHAPHTGKERSNRLERAIFACDELAGFITAVALVRPSRRLADVEVRSVSKKLKDKAFAAAVSRADILTGAAELGLPLEEHIAVVLAAMREIAAELGL